MDDFAAEPPTSVAPYAVLEIDRGASPSEVRTAYKKLALRYHPGSYPLILLYFFFETKLSNLPLIHISDKAAPSDQATAHTKFQEIAFAYAILSDPARRTRYDATGSTAESLAGVDGDFNWSDFFRQQFADAVTLDRFSLMKSEYQDSAEETRDLLAAYTKKKGDMNGIFNIVMMSDVLDDEDRFRVIIDDAIARGEVEPYDAYVKETAKSRELRRTRAERERKAAEKEAKKRGIHDKVFGEDQAGNRGQKRKAEPDMQELEAMLVNRVKSRASTFLEKLENLEAKYTSKSKSGKSRKSKKHEEPPEEAFQQAAARMKKRKTTHNPTPPPAEDNEDEEEEEEDEVDLDADSPAEEEDEEDNDDDDDDDDQGDNDPEGENEEKEEEEEEAPVRKKRRRMPQRKGIATTTTTKKSNSTSKSKSKSKRTKKH